MTVAEGWSPVGCHILLLHKMEKNLILVHHAEQWRITFLNNHFISLMVHWQTEQLRCDGHMQRQKLSYSLSERVNSEPSSSLSHQKR